MLKGTAAGLRNVADIRELTKFGSNPAFSMADESMSCTSTRCASDRQSMAEIGMIIPHFRFSDVELSGIGRTYHLSPNGFELKESICAAASFVRKEIGAKPHRASAVFAEVTQRFQRT